VFICRYGQYLGKNILKYDMHKILDIIGNIDRIDPQYSNHVTLQHLKELADLWMYAEALFRDKETLKIFQRILGQLATHQIEDVYSRVLLFKKGFGKHTIFGKDAEFVVKDSAQILKLIVLFMPEFFTYHAKKLEITSQHTKSRVVEDNVKRFLNTPDQLKLNLLMNDKNIISALQETLRYNRDGNLRVAGTDEGRVIANLKSMMSLKADKALTQDKKPQAFRDKGETTQRGASGMQFFAQADSAIVHTEPQREKSADLERLKQCWRDNLIEKKSRKIDNIISIKHLIEALLKDYQGIFPILAEKIRQVDPEGFDKKGRLSMTDFIADMQNASVSGTLARRSFDELLKKFKFLTKNDRAQFPSLVEMAWNEYDQKRRLSDEMSVTPPSPAFHSLFTVAVSVGSTRHVGAKEEPVSSMPYSRK
jgi:hypothetical protein